jgi:regulator of nucleoside diphosphate kinase
VKTNSIVISEFDHRRLQRLIEHRRESGQDTETLSALEHELERANIISSDEIARDVVTMYSRVRVRDLDRRQEAVYQIVLPGDADAARNRISVLAPIGTGLLGYRAGDLVEWPVPSGLRRLRVVAVEHQPEVLRAAA